MTTLTTLGPFKINEIHQGDALACLEQLPDACIQSCITSPPYWGLRDYGVEGQLGLEPTPEEYVAAIVEIFREVKRVLRPDGSLWLNYGDSYFGGGGASGHTEKTKNLGRTTKSYGAVATGNRKCKGSSLKPKDLVGMPWRIAFALQADGWYLRADIIWHKPNPMPESVTDRPTKSHEYLFLLTKSPQYFYDNDAIREPQTGNAHSRGKGITPKSTEPGSGIKSNTSFHKATCEKVEIEGGRNKRTVWTIPTQSFSGAHFATFPQKLVKPCILAGTSAHGACSSCGAPWIRITKNKSMEIKRSKRIHPKGHTRSSGTMISPAESITTGWKPSCACENAHNTRPCIILDPFIGSGTVALVALKHDRAFIGFDLSSEYCGTLSIPRLNAAKSSLSLKESAQGQLPLFPQEGGKK